MVHIQMLSLKMLQKHTVLKPPQQNSSQDDAVPAGTRKKRVQRTLTLFGITSSSLGKPMPKEMQLLGGEKKVLHVGGKNQLLTKISMLFKIPFIKILWFWSKQENTTGLFLQEILIS